MDLQDALSAGALGFSLLSVYTAGRAAKTALLGQFVVLERSLKETPTAFRFHGVSCEEMKAHGVEPNELSYLIATCNIGTFYHRLTLWFVWWRFREGHHRYRMCANPDFRRAWPLVRRMMTPSGFIRRMDRTISHIVSQEAAFPKTVNHHQGAAGFAERVPEVLPQGSDHPTVTGSQPPSESVGSVLNTHCTQA